MTGSAGTFTANLDRTHRRERIKPRRIDFADRHYLRKFLRASEILSLKQGQHDFTAKRSNIGNRPYCGRLIVIEHDKRDRFALFNQNEPTDIGAGIVDTRPQTAQLTENERINARDAYFCRVKHIGNVVGGTFGKRRGYYHFTLFILADGLAGDGKGLIGERRKRT